MTSAAESKYLEAQGGSLEGPSVCAPDPAPTPGPSLPKRGLVEAYILGIALGWMGAHHFYLRRPGWGVLYIFTFGLFGVGYIVDWVRMPWLVKRSNRQAEHPGLTHQERTLEEAYLLWFPLGLFGAHHFYLRQLGWGFAYFFTCGLFGLGWLMDVACIPSMLKDYKKRLEPDPANPENIVVTETKQRSLTCAYRLCLFPLTGLFGGHHYYMGRTAFGLFCTFTLGGFGVTWIIDWFRLPCLMADARKRISENRGFKERRLDDCYFVAFPAGLFGAHHFYLRRVGWGCLYLFTAGLFGIGWIVDLCRMFWLVKRHKAELEAQRRQLESVNVGGHTNPIVVGQDGLVITPGPDDLPRYVTVVPPGTQMPQHSQTLAPGTYAITPAPPYSAVAGPEPPVLPQVQVPPAYGASGYNSWSTIDSSDVDQPPSYEYSVHQNQANEKKE